MENVFDYERNKEDDLYNILGCSEHSTTEQILTEYKARVLDLHPDKNPDDPQAAQKFARLAQAKDILTDPEKRQAYDTWNNSGITVPFEKWQALRDATKTTLHWASVKPQPTIQSQEHMTTTSVHPSSSDDLDSSPFKVKEPISHAAVYSNQNVQWERDPPSDILKKFRNYEI
ncbi:dnaJ homolog subfamily C member 12-like [Saccostrea echinata]|uniref:dnaJ homolog subfamily C member 12-like n=1 Tax=Saccostrea echinata TaxID=191078 RepID=UPI002A8044CA|nr:dnaJ homolog subfamily C member 12-like [Saccostrea echinata]